MALDVPEEKGEQKEEPPRLQPIQRPWRATAVAMVGVFILALFYTFYLARDFFLPLTLAWILSLLLKPLIRDKSPFADHVPKSAALFVEPLVVAEIEYRRWPARGMVHQAAFKGVRTDKNPRQVVREDRMCEAQQQGSSRQRGAVES